MTLREFLRNHANDYSRLEALYLAKAGTDLIAAPLESPLVRLEKPTLFVSILIPAWNSAGTLKQCLTAIQESSFNRQFPDHLEVIVIDDGSTDGTWDLLTSLNPALNFRAIHQSHLSQSQALNTGIWASEGDVIIFCDADMILTPFSIEELVKRHEILKDVILIGFRYDVHPEDRRIGAEIIGQTFHTFPPMFFGDNRVSFHWPCWPENMCATTGHLKAFGQGRRFWMTDGVLPDGDYWDLPRMVYGALFSIRRRDLEAIGGFDERCWGWGWCDTLVAGKGMGLGRFVVPVYSAVGLHVAHPDRSTTKWAEAEANHSVLQQVMDQPVNTTPQDAFASASKRPVRSIHRKHQLGPRDVPAKWYDIFHRESSDPERFGQYLFALGRYKETADIYRHLKRDKTTKSTVLKLARTLRAGGHQLECIEALNEAISIFPECSSLLVEVARTFAEIGYFEAAHDYFRRASSSATTDPIVEYISGCSLEDHRRRGEKHAAVGFCSVAARDFEAILMRQPTDVSANERWSRMTDGLHRQQKGRPEC